MDSEASLQVVETVTATETDSEIQTAVTIMVTTTRDHKATTEVSEINPVERIRTIREARIIRTVAVSETHNRVIRIKTKTAPERNLPVGSEEAQAPRTTLSKTAVLRDSRPAEVDLDKTIINKKTNS